MHTRKQKEEERNTKLQLINMVSSINILSCFVVSFNRLYAQFPKNQILLLCAGVLLQSDKMYFYKKDLYKYTGFDYNYFNKDVYSRYKDCFTIIETNHKGNKLILSDIGSTTLQSFYSIFIQQLSNSI